MTNIELAEILERVAAELRSRPEPFQPHNLTVYQLADATGIHLEAIRKMARTGEIQCIPRAGRRGYLFNESAIQQVYQVLIDSHKKRERKKRLRKAS